ncbi:MAG TPA: DUF1569 domain-containing protein [Terriglobales bacterium]|nr:DUF1569 domain-containing protein [Terriglobales bacterium]
MPRKTLANAAGRQEITTRLAQVQKSSARRWGKMTAHQMICHLSDSFRVTIGDKSVTPAVSRVPRKLMKWVALQLPVPWPKNVETRPEVDQMLGGTPPGDFELDYEELLRLMQRFTQQPRDFEFHPHPFFGTMSEHDWMRWGYLHMDHHLRQFGV